MPVKRTGRLFRKYALVFAVLVGGVLLTSGAVELYFSFGENQAALATLQLEKASGAAGRIKSFLSELNQQLDWVIQPAYAVGPVDLQERRMDYLRLLRLAPPIIEVAYIDATGREQLRVRRNAADVLDSQLDVSGEPLFREAKTNRIYYGPATFTGGSEPHMTIARAEPGQAAGVTVAEVNCDSIYDVVAGIRFGEVGQPMWSASTES